MKNVNFVPKDIQRILSSHKISKRYNEQKVFHKKAILKNFARLTEKHQRFILFFNKNAGLQTCSLIKKRLQHMSFLANIEKVLRTPILKNMCEWLFLRDFHERFPIWTNNRKWRSKTEQQQKNRSKTLQYKKNLPFLDVLYCFLFLYFSTTCQATFDLGNKRW